ALRVAGPQGSGGARASAAGISLRHRKRANGLVRSESHSFTDRGLGGALRDELSNLGRAGIGAMILIYGRTDDPPLSMALEALQEIGAPYALLAQSTLNCESLQIEVGAFGVKGMLIVAGKKINLEQIRSVYARPLGLPTRMVGSTNPARAQRIHENLFEWLDMSPALVVNRPRAMQAN